MDYLGDLAFRLIIILFPGIISTLIYKKLVIKKKWESIDYGLNTLLYGIIAYLFLQAIFYCRQKGDLVIWQRLQDNQIVPYEEVLWASSISVFVGLFGAMIENKNFINKLGTAICITAKYGENNLFYNFLSRNEVVEVHVKDPLNNLIYTGYLKYFSEDEDVREIVLEDVDLYEYETAIHMNKVKSVYLSHAKSDNLIIEIPIPITNQLVEENGKAKKQPTPT